MRFYCSGLFMLFCYDKHGDGDGGVVLDTGNSDGCLLDIKTTAGFVIRQRFQE